MTIYTGKSATVITRKRVRMRKKHQKRKQRDMVILRKSTEKLSLICTIIKWMIMDQA